MMRAAVLLLTLALALSGCAALTGRPFVQWSDDAKITARVKARLIEISFRNVGRINVDTYDGVVYLSGSTPTPEGKARAEAAARAVEGVKQVVSNLVARQTPAEGSALPIAAVTRTRPVPAPLVGVARLEGTGAYDAGGRLVATVHVVPMAELAHSDREHFAAPRPIEHVTIHAMPADSSVPMPHYLLVLWHIPEPRTPPR